MVHAIGSWRRCSGLDDAHHERGVATWLPELERLALERATLLGSRRHHTYPLDVHARCAAASLDREPRHHGRGIDLAVTGLAALPARQLTALTISLARGKSGGAELYADSRAAMSAAVERQTRVTAPVPAY